MGRSKWALLIVLLGMMVAMGGCFGGGSIPTGGVKGRVFAPDDFSKSALVVKAMEIESLEGYAPLKNAQITITGSTSFDTTDDEGRFMLDNVRVGDQVLTITHGLDDRQSFRVPIREGYITSIFDPLELSGKGYYLLIGVGRFGRDYWTQYGYPEDPLPLPSVMNDLDMMERTFGFDNASSKDSIVRLPGRIVRLVDQQATQTRILRELNALIDQMSEEDYLVIYFSGHGVGGGGHGFDAVAVYDEFLGDWELWDHINRQFNNKEMPVTDVTIILDACNSGSFADGEDRRVELKAFRKPGYTVIASSRPEQDSHVYVEMNQGLFTYYADMALAQNKADINGDGVITAWELYDYVAPRVKSHSNGRQEVYIWEGSAKPTVLKYR